MQSKIILFRRNTAAKMRDNDCQEGIMEPVNLPTEIDTPQQVLLWSVDEFAPFMIFMVAGNFLNHFFMGLGAGWVVSHLYRRFKNTRPDGYLLHLLYWIGLTQLKGLTIVDPYKREYRP